MKLITIHPHRLPDYSIGVTVQVGMDDGEIVPITREMTIAEIAWIQRLLAQFLYEEVSR